MAVETYLRFHTKDAQGVTDTSEFRINDSAFGATTLPTAAKILVVLNAIFGDVKPSDQIVTSYEVAVVQTVPESDGGSGSSATAIAARLRSTLGGLEEELYSLPGLNKSNVTFNPRSRSEISMIGAPWTAIRAALADPVIAYSNNAGAAIPEDEIFEVGTSYNGKRKAPQPS